MRTKVMTDDNAEFMKLRTALFKATSTLRMISTTIRTGRVQEPTQQILQAWAREMDEASDPLEVSLYEKIPWPSDLREAIQGIYERVHGDVDAFRGILQHYGLLP